MENPDHGANVINFMAILQSIDYNEFERIWNASDEISAKLLSSLLKREVLVVVVDWYDFEFSIKAAERKHRILTPQFTYRKLKLLITEKFQSNCKVTLVIRTIKSTWCNTFSTNAGKHCYMF